MIPNKQFLLRIELSGTVILNPIVSELSLRITIIIRSRWFENRLDVCFEANI